MRLIQTLPLSKISNKNNTSNSKKRSNDNNSHQNQDYHYNLHIEEGRWLVSYGRYNLDVFSITNEEIKFHGSLPLSGQFSSAITSVAIHRTRNIMAVAGTLNIWVFDLDHQLKVLTNSDFWCDFLLKLPSIPMYQSSILPHTIQGVLFDNSKQDISLFLYSSKYLCYLKFETKEFSIIRENFSNKVNFCSFIGKDRVELLMIYSTWERVLSKFKQPFIPKIYGTQ